MQSGGTKKDTVLDPMLLEAHTPEVTRRQADEHMPIVREAQKDHEDHLGQVVLGPRPCEA